ncbi:MAG: NCS2 family permease [Candidatus Omnitrophica bacterium]|nr:NCS2 family permease [Candidatus Omnitrophota bacterium]
MQVLEKLFHLKENKTNLNTEMVAGITTFMTMSYIIFVQPAILSIVGMDFGAVMSATCIASCIATLLMGILANYPIALAPAMGHNVFFVYTVCLGMNVSWQIALGANFISGVIFIFASLFSFRQRIIEAVPDSLKQAIAAGIGLLIAMIGLQWSGIITSHPFTLVTLGNLKSKVVVLSIVGTLFMGILLSRRIKGAILWGILFNLILGIILGIIKFEGILSKPPSILPTFLKLDIISVFKGGINMLVVIFVLFFLDLFDTVGTLIGVGKQAGFITKEGKLPRAQKALLSDAVGTVEGALLGTSTITSYIESTSGIACGGRTGLSNVFTSICFIIALFFYPLIRMVGGGYKISEGVILYPVIAPALIMVGALMLNSITHINWYDYTEVIPCFITILIMPLTLSITEGIAFGFISYTILKLVCGKAKDVSWFIYFFSFLFVLRYIFLK